jgi:lysozyme
VPVDTRALPPALDLELGGNCALRPSRADVRAEIKVWLDAVEAHYGKRAILYMTEEFHDAYYSGSGLIRRLWLRSIARKPGFGPPWNIWQYHNRGRVQGIAGNVDLNVMAGANVSLR